MDHGCDGRIPTHAIPMDCVRHLYEAHEITVTELDDRDDPFMWPLFHIFDRHQLSAHDEAHGGEDVLGLCIFFDRKLDRYREEQRRSKLSKVDRQAEDWARYRREAEDALSPAARRCLEEVRASGGTKTYTGGEDFEAVRWLELRQTMWYKDGPRDYQPGEPTVSGRGLLGGGLSHGEGAVAERREPCSGCLHPDTSRSLGTGCCGPGHLGGHP